MGNMLQAEDLRPGVVIRLRNRIWRVDGVDGDELRATPLDGRDTRRWRLLLSVEGDGIESGEMPPPDPAVLSDSATQDLLLRAYRLSMIHGSAPFLGLQRSRAIPEEFQLVPLLMAMDAPAVRLLIGDDVGVGKSIEAGLIISELFARGAADRLLVVVPASLREQWQETLDRFFHMDSVIMAGHTRPALERRLIPGQSPWEAHPVVISSIDYLKRRIGEVLSHRWDVVLVDEAHIAARPHAVPWAGPVQKDRWDFLEAVGQSENVRHLLLLSATPHSGYTDSFESLLEMLNPETVSAGGVRRDVARRHVIQRRRRDIREWYDARNPFPERDLHDVIIPLKRPEVPLLAALRKYAETLARIEGRNVGQWVALHLQRRALSSPAAILKSLENRRKTARRRIAGRDQADAETEAEVEAAVMDQDSLQDLEDEERYARLDGAQTSGTEEELRWLDDLQRLAKKVTRRQDGKLVRVVQLLPSLLRRHANAPRVLIFTRYKDTLDYLVKELRREAGRERELEGMAVFSIHGEMAQKDRRKEFHEFEQTSMAVCVATDCISEGLDLQRGCAELIHYELPWNPNRLEQRNGRIDRYGQPEETVGIWNLVRQDELDVTILKVLVRKAQKIREDHGFCPVYFSSAGRLRELIRQFGRTGQLSLPFAGRDDDDIAGAALDDEEQEQIRRIKEESFYGQSDIRLPRVRQALTETYSTVGSPEEIRGFIRSALNRVGASVTETTADVWTINLSGTPLAEFGEVAATFDPRLVRDEPDLELLDIAHPIVRRLIEHVRQDAAGSETGRFAVRGSASIDKVIAVLHVLARFVTASDPPVLMEELIPVAIDPYFDNPVEGDPLGMLRSATARVTHDAESLKEMAQEALGAAHLQSRVQEVVEARRSLLIQRQKEIAELSSGWTEGVEDVSVASTDLLTLTLLVPNHG